MKSRQAGLWIALGVFFCSLATMVFEVTLTRIFSVLLWYHFAYFVVSLSLFGIGLGGLLTLRRQEEWLPDLPHHLARAAQLQSATMFLALVMCLSFKFEVGFTWLGATHFLVLFGLCALPFVFTGIALSLAFAGRPDEAGRIYAFDLVGAAMAGPLFVASISWISGPSVGVLAAGLSLAAAPLFYAAGSRGALKAAIAVGCCGAIFALLAARTPIFSVKFTKSYDEHADVEVEKWSPLARLTVYPRIFFTDATTGFGWGMSSRYRSARAVEQRWVEQDNSAGTPITRFDGDFAAVEHLKYDVSAFVYHLREKPKVFVLGAGGGRDILTALSFGSPMVKSSDINSEMLDLLRTPYKEFSGDLYGRADVEVVVGDGRSVLRSQNDSFDVVQMSLIDSWAATSAGALALAENSLYTVEAFVDYLRHLEDDGILSVTRYLFMPRSQCLRVVSLARRALEELGVRDPRAHIVVVSTSVFDGVASVLVKRSPWTPDEIAQITEHAERLGFPVLLVPGSDERDVYQMMLAAPSIEQFSDRYPFDIRPPTDEWPFFFQMARFGDVPALLRGEKFSGQSWNYYATAVVALLCGISVLMVAVFYFSPLVFMRCPLPRDSGGIVAVLIGLGFMFVEIPLIQMSTIFLGHPTYGLLYVLCPMLVASGAGSLRSGAIPVAMLDGRLRRALIVAAVLIFGIALTGSALFGNCVGAPFYARAALVVGIAALPAYFMGQVLPSLLRGARGDRSAIPWIWALNGGASVTGAVSSMALGMQLGFNAVFAAAGACYLLAALARTVRTTSK